MSSQISFLQPGQFSPLRYPGGKGKLARFVSSIIRLNGLSDGTYVEPFAGGAAIACELLLTGLMRRIVINDLSRPIFAFWQSALFHTDAFVRMIETTPVTVDEWKRQKATFGNPNEHDNLELGFAAFYLNRTNRSGILNGGVIGGLDQSGPWKIDARYPQDRLIARIRSIASLRNRITLLNEDAEQLITSNQKDWSRRTLVYLDPPYYEKGQHLYYNYYRPTEHARLSSIIRSSEISAWIVSYDDVSPIHDLYCGTQWLQYSISYAARERVQGREAMFFSDNLKVPDVLGSMIEVERFSWPHDSIQSRDGRAGARQGIVPPKREFTDSAERHVSTVGLVRHPTATGEALRSVEQKQFSF